MHMAAALNFVKIIILYRSAENYISTETTLTTYKRLEHDCSIYTCFSSALRQLFFLLKFSIHIKIRHFYIIFFAPSSILLDVRAL